MSAMSRRVWWAAFAILCIVTIIRIAATHRILSPTYDEPVHVAAGYDYLTTHTYRLDRQHPPLARMLFALPFANVAIPQSLRWNDRGNALLAARGDSIAGIAAARRGNLVFVLIAICGVALWANELFGKTNAVVAATLFALLPPIVGHGGLATTDMSGTAAFAVAMFAFDRWLAVPNWKRTFGLGAAIGFGCTTKLSFPIFFLVGAAIMAIVRRRVAFARAAAAVAIAGLVIWSVYLFSFGTMESVDPLAPVINDELLGNPAFARIPLFAPEFFDGLLGVKLHDLVGHPSFLLGHVSDSGWWFYFPVALAVKTPLPFLALAIAGAVMTIRRRKHIEVVAIAAALLLVVLPSSINLGIRHILVIYVPLSILAAHALLSMRWKPIAAALALWVVIDSVLAHPDALPWMNALAGRHPERVLDGSNFDWGQDLVRLRDECRRRNINSLGVFVFTTADLRALGLPPTHPIDPRTPSNGWIAVSESAIEPAQASDPNAYRWLSERGSFVRVGKTVRLYAPIERSQ